MRIEWSAYNVHRRSRLRQLLGHCLLAVLLLTFCSIQCAVATSSTVPPVEVQLSAPWPKSPLLLEALEAAEREQKGSLFTLIDVLFEKKGIADANDEQVLQHILGAFDSHSLLSRPGQRTSFRSSLSLHAETPRIAAAWQFYNTSGVRERAERRLARSNESCSSWVDFDGRVFCSAAELQPVLDEVSPRSQPGATHQLPGDHTKETFDPKKSTAVLYGDLKSANFFGLHRLLSKHTVHLNYVLRWKPLENEELASLSGYGAYLDLKKVDYLVIDDRKLSNVASQPERVKSGSQSSTERSDVDDRDWLSFQLRSSEDSQRASLGSLADDEIRSLGLRAAQLITTSQDPIRAMKQLAQDFPSHAVALARDSKSPPPSLAAEVEQMQATVVEAGGEDLWLNGKNIESKDFQPLGLLSIMRDERTLISSLLSLGMDNKQVHDLLVSPNISKAFASATESNQPPTFDASDRMEREQLLREQPHDKHTDGAITYWNDLEAKDDIRYAAWPSDLRSLLRPLYPGSFPVIRRNVFNVIVAMDPAKLETIKLLSDNVQMAANKVGLRWGFVPLLSESVEQSSVAMARLIWLAIKQLDATVTSKWLRRVAMTVKEGEEIDVEIAGRELDKFLYTTVSERQAMIEGMDVTNRIRMTRAWTRRLRPNETGSGGVFLNGQYLPYHAQLFQTLHQLVAMQLQILAPLIYFGQLDETQTDISTYFYDLPDTFSARSELLFPPEGGHIQIKAVDLSKAADIFGHIVEEQNSTVSVWLVGDRSSAKARHLEPALLDITGQSGTPFGVVSSHDLGIDLPEEDVGFMVNGKLVHGFNPSDISPAEYDAVINQERRKVDLLLPYLNSHNAKQLAITTSIVNAAFFVDRSKEGFFAGTTNARTAVFDHLSLPQTSFTVGNTKTASLQFSILIDPLGKNVQRWSGVLSMLATQPDVSMRVVLNPQANLTELPLRRYYRSSDAAELQFDSNGMIRPHSLTFNDMPQDAVLTMGLDAPPAWLTMPIETIYDLDNIRLRDSITPTVRAIYQLRYVLIEGHVRDMVSRTTPRGLELVLESSDGNEKLDTIVMANLAYFQFRAKPGYYHLRIREGRSAKLFETVSVGNAGWDSPPVEVTGDVIVLDTFHGSTLYPRVAKRRGKEKESLVMDEESSGQSSRPSREAAASQRAPTSIGVAIESVWKMIRTSFSSILPSTESDQNAGTNSVAAHADINVFTVASGHLYERMTYIMILSTLKHTNRSVKFWFIENFLSPSFKSFIPHLAREYGFTYELVTYAWPHWLRPQSEKQRSIWGMKVLFLDVLFPLSLSNVIFVDADQIVRADLMELVQTDLQGAPYGFAPMGNDSYDMDNFRFWETGYWKQFLRGKPYPISALYVVDLDRFRLLAAGDKLRGHYQALSADPNSLSNLDQDLVASMIHNVPIFSLPREWLWCETWCSTDWYDQAKSIDLCSNPKTHEPKLDRARRQIPEWTPLDEEVGRLARRLEEEGSLQANVVASGGKNAKIDRTVTARDRSQGLRHEEL